MPHADEDAPARHRMRLGGSVALTPDSRPCSDAQGPKPVAHSWPTDEVTGDVVITTAAQTLRGRRQHGSHGVLRADRSRHPDSSGQAAVTLVHGVSEATR
jgi:hypothetical protein